MCVCAVCVIDRKKERERAKEIKRARKRERKREKRQKDKNPELIGPHTYGTLNNFPMMIVYRC